MNIMSPVGFMGIAEQHLVLFISDVQEERLGQRIVTFWNRKYSVNDLAANEQNFLAKGFYEYM